MNLIVQLENGTVLNNYAPDSDINLVFAYNEYYVISVKTTPARSTLIITVRRLANVE